MNDSKIYAVIFKQELSRYLQNQQNQLGPVAGREPECPALLQHLQAAHRPEHFVQPGYPLGGCAGSALSQPCPTEGSRKGKKSSEVTLCSQGNFCTGASVVRLGQAEPWVNGPLLWTFQSFSEKTGHHEVGEAVWDWSQEGKMQVLKQYLLENGVGFFFIS